MKRCDDCKWAEWKRTAAGKLHPDKSGRCTFVVRIPVLPLAFRWGYTQTQPNISGGFIYRKNEFPSHCPTYSPSDSNKTLVGSFKRAEIAP